MSTADRLNALLDEWERLTQQGKPADLQALCDDCPELLPELSRQVEALQKMNALIDKNEQLYTRMPPRRGKLGPPDWSQLDLAGIDAGRYRPIGFHAAGGLGRIFLARDTELNRDVALKLIKHELLLGTDGRRRFELEAEITGRLDHPGVVPVYGFGLGKEGRPYYAMRFVRGERLEDAIERFHQTAISRSRNAKQSDAARTPGERSRELQRLLRSFLTVCQTVAYAHSRGVIHRDLKPANVMLGKYGETLVVDWGLAKVIDDAEVDEGQSEELLRPAVADELSQSLIGFAKGTSAFMSPEQAEGRWDIVGTATDVYSLGVILYMLLTGRRAFTGETEWEIIDKVRAGKFEPPRQVNRRVHPALEAVCLKAMKLTPAERYAGAQELAADIEQWLAGEPVSAWREPWGRRVRRWLRRHRKLRAGVNILLVATVVGLAAATLVQRKKNVQTRVETEQAQATLEQTLAAINEMVAASRGDASHDQTAMRQARAPVLRSALKYYQDFLAKNADDPKLRSELAEARGNVARILDELATLDGEETSPKRQPVAD
jgi:serine/threonine-protein kinase